jgi:muramidase (phage lysozyme)
MTRSDLQKALTHQNVTAFLKAIRLGEGTTDDLGYYRIVGGGTFTDDSQHPRVRVYIKRYDVHSTAAGAYQIIWPTWKTLQGRYNFPDFSPECQDEAAVALIEGRGALLAVKQGRLADAVKLCAAEWASLPGSTAGQRTESYENVRQVFMNNGGVLA